jgi:integrase
MINSKEAFFSQYVRELPESAYTKSGVLYHPRESRWSFRDGLKKINCNFEAIPGLGQPLVHGLKVALIWRFANISAETVVQDFHLAKRLIRSIATHRKSENSVEFKNQPIERISSQDLLNFRSANKENGPILARVSGLLQKWHGLGAPGVGDDAIQILKKITISNRPQGVAVATYSPKNGPFTDLEYEAIQDALNAGFKSGSINERDFLLVWLFIYLGGRPISMASLKLCDLIVPKDLTNGSDYLINLPKAKQRGALARDQFTPLILMRPVAELLHLWVKSIYKEFSKLLSDPWQAPIFPDTKQASSVYPKGFEYHPTSADISNLVKKLFDRLSVHSERLSGAMQISATRFRRTYGTRLAEEGSSSYEIARLMGHTDARSCDVYIALTSKMIDRIDKATAFAMAPLAQAFSGRIISMEADATRPSRDSRIIDFRIDQSGAGFGSCGQSSFCAFSKPLGCYGCSSFEPWLDGPHEAAFDFMLNKRDELMKKTDIRIAKVNDRNILGCAQVILRIKEIKANTP